MLPEVAEDNKGSQYNAAHSDWDQQGHVVDLSIYVDYRGEDKEVKKRWAGWWENKKYDGIEERGGMKMWRECQNNVRKRNLSRLTSSLLPLFLSMIDTNVMNVQQLDIIAKNAWNHLLLKKLGKKI